MVGISQERRVDWENYHRTLSRLGAKSFGFEDVASPADPAAFFRRTAKLLGNLLREAIDQGVGLMPVGSAWSFSEILKGEGWLLETSALGRMIRLDRTQLGPGAASDRLLLVGAGTTIRDLNHFLEPELSLATSGAHDGQTIAGALGTGIHGSVLGYGGFQNHVRGVHLVVSAERSVWVEPGPAPVLSPGLAAQIADDIVLDPDIFAAALVHLGGLGVVNAVLLEAEPGYTVDVVRRKAVLDIRFIDQIARGGFGAFARSVWPDATEDPYYLEIILNPFRPYTGYGPDLGKPALVTMFFKRQSVEVDIGVLSALDRPEAADALNLLAQGTDRHMGAELLLPPRIVADVVAWEFKPEPLDGQAPARMTWGQANGPHKRPRIGPIEIDLFNAAYALPREGLAAALPVMLDAFNEDGGGHLVFTLRFVQSASGLLAFTRFPETVVVNMDGIRTGASRDAARRVALALEGLGVPFSQHWGKMGVISPSRFARDFGDPLDPTTPAGRWRRARYALLPAEVRSTFVNAAIASWGLA